MGKEIDVWGEKTRAGRMEVRAYHLLRSLQGTVVPQFFGTVKLPISAPPVLHAVTDFVQGLLLEYLDATSIEDIEQLDRALTYLCLILPMASPPTFSAGNVYPPLLYLGSKSTSMFGSVKYFNYVLAYILKGRWAEAVVPVLEFQHILPRHVRCPLSGDLISASLPQTN
ncbi:uncharacterized protein BT62DRAFT_1005281 [Guyanagaster necrorhizus]|uniref:Uncharacterized protein n=1 Tax=Guyanagaster necrorhizus TaxID=856835 RepID=A0A9P8ATD8_9AGAR|nr:uncharacterized protein BT62DRAFT_1005281 [Guyanagaster necrorhizus MCA 3950]KAG7446886.1 hypothetical protein BT62DRAFT_1005281 [Guyanagaster necrorhizus MCA 3950]